MYAGVAKHGQRRKIEGLVLSGPRVQISSPALIFTKFIRKNEEFQIGKSLCMIYMICMKRFKYQSYIASSSDNNG
jgi:hypothetical protein